MFESWRFEAEMHELGEHMGRPSLRPEMASRFIRMPISWTGSSSSMSPSRPSARSPVSQYTVFNGVSGWQLYHRPRYTVPVSRASRRGRPTWRESTAWRNELVMAVSEDFGGWGVHAKLEDLEGVALED